MRLFEFTLTDGRVVYLNVEQQLHSLEPIIDAEQPATHIIMYAPEGFAHYDVRADVKDILRAVARSEDIFPGYKTYTNPQMRR